MKMNATREHVSIKGFSKQQQPNDEKLKIEFRRKK